MSIRKVGDFELGKSMRRIRRVKQTMPRQIGNTALKYFIRSFRMGGFTDITFMKWVPRRRRITRRRVSRVAFEPANLIKSSKLFRSMQVITANFNKISVGTKGVPYARRHNEGLTDKLGRKMPKWKVMGNSRTLDKILESKIRAEIDKVFI